MSTEHEPNTAVVLLSGGLDSAVVAGLARRSGRRVVALSFDYGQRHRAELEAGRRVAEAVGVERRVVMPLDLRLVGGSALTADIDVPKDAEPDPSGGVIRVTYVPARNLIFLSIAAGLAEAAGAGEIWLGVNAVDYSGYPDCRPDFINAFERTAALATRAGVEPAAAGPPGVRVRTPLIEMTKAEIVRAGAGMGLDLGMTLSCYDPIGAHERGPGAHCGLCEACRLRRRGFEAAGIADPTRYANSHRFP